MPVRALLSSASTCKPPVKDTFEVGTAPSFGQLLDQASLCSWKDVDYDHGQ